MIERMELLNVYAHVIAPPLPFSQICLARFSVHWMLLSITSHAFHVGLSPFLTFNNISCIGKVSRGLSPETVPPARWL